ncbi:MAG TPA: S1C family serine protease, partial [Methylomirabilota bacterium]
MRRAASIAAALLLALPALLAAAPQSGAPRLDPKRVSAFPSHIKHVAPAIIGIHVEVPPDRPSAATLGAERWGSGVLFDAAGFAVTVSYVLIDAARVDVVLRDGRKVEATVAGLDLESGLGVIKLDGPGPWPVAALGDSTKIAVGDVTGTVGMDEEGSLVATPGTVKSIRSFAASWEYMLDRALFVAPYNSAFGGAALVDQTGAVVGITSLRLGEAPFVNLAIPIEQFLGGKDELIAKGRVESRRPRPWIGLYTRETDGGVVVAGVSPVGPARTADLRPGDLIVRVNGEQVSSQAEFYRRLWLGSVGQDVQLVVMRAARLEAITVRSVDRYRLFPLKDR